MIDSRLNAAALMRDLHTRRVGRRIIVLDEIDSTNAYALNTLAAEGREQADGAAVFAERQTAGRGRLGRSWESPRGASLLFSVLVWDNTKQMRPAGLVLAAGVAVATGIEQATDAEPAIRWPNDVYINDRKVAGILVESRPAPGGFLSAIGIGVNCLQHAGHFSDDVRRRATSLEMATSHPIDRHAVARAILHALDHWLTDGRERSAQLIDAWKAHSTDVGQRVELVHEGAHYHGRVLDVQPETGLLVQLDDGGRREFDPAVTSRIT